MKYGLGIKKKITFFFAVLSTLLLSVSLAFLFCSVSQASTDSGLDWKRIIAGRFHLIFDAKNQDLAEVYLSQLLRAEKEMTSYFSQSPPRVIVILNDRTDLSNGYATPFPYPLIEIYPVLPIPTEVIGEYDDWAWQIVAHEYTHILTFEQRGSLVRGLHSLFGSWVTPTLLLPRWYTEGLAVEMETRLSHQGGRLRSLQQDGSVRALVGEGRLSSIHLAEINESNLETWPYGGRPYLFGSLLWSHFVSRSSEGLHLIPRLSDRYGSRLPYFLNGPLVDEFGKTAPELLDDMIKDLQRRVDAEVGAEEKVSVGAEMELTPVSLPTGTGGEVLVPTISPDGYRLAYIFKNDTGKRSITVIERKDKTKSFSKETVSIMGLAGEKEGDGGSATPPSFPGPRYVQQHQSPGFLGLFWEKNWGIRESDAPTVGAIQRISWFPDSHRLIYDRVDELDEYREISDLYSLDLITQKVNPLTKGLRAREPHVSPSGKFITFVKVLPGKTNLWILDLRTSEVKLLWDVPLQDRISDPYFISDQEVLFTHTHQGKMILKSIRTDSLEVTQILPEGMFSRQGQVHIHSSSIPSSSHQIQSERPPSLSLLTWIGADTGKTNVYLNYVGVENSNGNPRVGVPKDLNSTRLVTDVNTYISSYTWDNDKEDVYVSLLTSNGYQLFRQTFQGEKNSSHLTKNPLYLDGPLLAHAKKHPGLLVDRYPGSDPSPGESGINSHSINFSGLSSASPFLESPSKYSPWEYLFPTYWMPFGYANEGMARLGFITGGQDPLERHSYSFYLEQNWTKSLTTYLLSYANNYTSYGIFLNGGQTFNYYPITGEITRLRSLGLSVQKQIFSLGKEWSGAVTVLGDEKQTTRDVDTVTSPSSDTGTGSDSTSTSSSASNQDMIYEKGIGFGLSYQAVGLSGAQISPESGQAYQLKWNFLEAKEDYNGEILQFPYQKLYISGVKFFTTKYLPIHHAFMVKTQVMASWDKVPTLYYETNSNSTSSPHVPISGIYLIRGYSSGVFSMRSLLNLNLEYRFPLFNLWSRTETVPVFLRRIHGALVLDFLKSLDSYGRFYDSLTKSYRRMSSSQIFSSGGGELKIDMTLGYILPMTLYLGAYTVLADVYSHHENQLIIGIQF